jgi:hypothetical protein
VIIAFLQLISEEFKNELIVVKLEF